MSTAGAAALSSHQPTGAVKYANLAPFDSQSLAGHRASVGPVTAAANFDSLAVESRADRVPVVEEYRIFN